MNIWSSALISLFLLLCAAGLMVSHVLTWRRVRRVELEPEELDYCRRQYRRRMQTSAMLGLLAVAIFAGQLATSLIESQLLVVFYWTGVLLVVGWVGLLALVDVVATRHHYSRLRQTYVVEQARLQAALRRMQATRGNGKAPAEDPQPQRDD